MQMTPYFRFIVSSAIIIGTLLLVGILDWIIKDYSVAKTTEGKRQAAGQTLTDNPTSEFLSKTRTKEVTIQRRTVIGDYLSRYNFTPQEIYDLILDIKPVYNLAKIKAGKVLELEFNEENTLLGFLYPIDDTYYLQVKKDDNGWVGKKELFPYEWKKSYVEGKIETNLFSAIDGLGEKPALATELSEIFAWDVDFYADLRKGDSFKILFDKKFLDGELKGYGPVLAAEFVNQGQQYRAIRFTFPDGHGDYFTPEGKSVRKELLKSPLKMGRVTSRFSYRRLHPVYKIYRPHYGVDIAAPVGTHVHAAGDGTVTFVGRKGQAGKMVEIRHPNNYTTQYLHLSRYARGVRRGNKVRQAQLIGYVGSSGASTGPHLDYRIKYRGKYVNPLKQKFKRALPLPDKYMNEFRTLAISVLHVLSSDESLRTYYLTELKQVRY